MIAEAQAIAEVAKLDPLVSTGIYGLLITNGFLIIRDLIKYRAEKAKARAAADEAEAKALKAQADALAEKGQASSGLNGHEKLILPHTKMLERHESEIKAVTAQFQKFERENREDHGKIFDEVGEVKTLLIERLPRAN